MLRNLPRLKTIFCLLLLTAVPLPLQATTIGRVSWSAKVTSVSDGDTVKVIFDGKEERVRLIGIDAPESKPNEKAKMDAQRSRRDLETIVAMGKEATRYVRTLVKRGTPVRIEFDVEKRDKYGRLLAYVYLSDGRMLNEEVVKAGYANLMTHPPNVKYQNRFLKA